MEHVAGGLVSISHMVPTLATAAAFDLCVSRYGPKEVAAEKAASVMYVVATSLLACLLGPVGLLHSG